ncbi:aspartate ammonia-lyase [Candidatus Woesebacteria bacterium]|nr:MAG: aspartate ammonia-lyase [Candidatus Woesebacteria bacterium]
MKKYYGEETRKALDNFHMTNTPVDLRLIKAVAIVKLAAIKANVKTGKIKRELGRPIIKAAKEVIDGKLDTQFPTDQIQGGAGTSINMNVNEVITSRANEILGSSSIHYLDHVNSSQSTNDVIPTAIRIVILEELGKYLISLNKLSITFAKKEKEFCNIVKVGRTHLQDAVPITLGREFGAYKNLIKRDIKRLEEIKKYLLITNLGGTAIGTSENASKDYITAIHEYLEMETGYKFTPSHDLVDATQNIDPLIHASYLIQLSSVGISKICSDLRLLASGPRAGLAEILLPSYQKGSSIMPGKTNPVILEAFNQVTYQVIGNTQVATQVILAGELELNTMLPVFSKTIIESLTFLTNGINSVNDTVSTIKANSEKIQSNLDTSLVLSTQLSKFIGYDRA